MRLAEIVQVRGQVPQRCNFSGVRPGASDGLRFSKLTCLTPPWPAAWVANRVSTLRGLQDSACKSQYFLRPKAESSNARTNLCGTPKPA